MVAVAAALVRPPMARAAVSCPPTLAGADPRLGGIEAEARLAWIDEHLARTAARARWWTWAWGLGIGGSGVASLAVVPSVERSARVDWYTSAGSAAIGVVPLVVAPLKVVRDARELHAGLAAHAPGAPPALEVCPLLADAEARLVRDAADQRDQQRWWFHAGNLAFNTGVALFLGLGFHHWTSGIINGVAGAAVGEALILTQPTGTIDDLGAYRAGQLGP